MIDTLSIKKYLKNPLQNFKLVSIRYTKKELDLINKLDIDKYSTFNYYGNKTNIDNNKLNIFLNNIGSNDNIDINILYNLIYKIISKITKAFDTDYIWFNVRVSLPNNNYDIERWHKDGPFFMNPERINQYKFVTTLKGPGTLFYKKSTQINKIYENNIKKRRSEQKKTGIEQSFDDKIIVKYRKKIANTLKNYEYNQSKNNEGLIFTTGNNYNNLANGILHSEPKINVHRLFIIILPGSRGEINELIKRWNIKETTSYTPAKII